MGAILATLSSYVYGDEAALTATETTPSPGPFTVIEDSGDRAIFAGPAPRLGEGEGEGEGADEGVVYKTALLGTASGRRLAREVETLRAVAHAHVVRVVETFECGGDPPTTLAISLERAVRGTLADNIAPFAGDKAKEPPAQRVLLHIALALGHVHACGFVHLDVKATNVLVFSRTTGPGPDGTDGDDHEEALYKLADYDLAARRGDPIGRRGTYGYMPPELSDLGPGALIPADPSADVFSLGALAARDLGAAATTAPADLRAIVAAMRAVKPIERPSADALALSITALRVSSPPSRAT